MTLQELAIKVLEATESAGLDFLIVGAIAAGTYGGPGPRRTWIFSWR